MHLTTHPAYDNRQKKLAEVILHSNRPWNGVICDNVTRTHALRLHGDFINEGGEEKAGNGIMDARRRVRGETPETLRCKNAWQMTRPDARATPTCREQKFIGV